MDYGSIDILSTSQGPPAKDASLSVTYRTIWGCPKDVLPSGPILAVLVQLLLEWNTYLLFSYEKR